MLERAFMQVDVFTDTAYFGNPVGVVLEAKGVSDETSWPGATAMYENGAGPG
jgi:predicted PhzF superfamily epimerase YddE/YHI9